MLLAGLSTGNMIGLALVAGIFITFALVCSFVIPRSHPDFPGKAGIGVFAIVCVVLFLAQLTAVLHFGVEKKEPAEHAANTPRAQAARALHRMQAASLRAGSGEHVITVVLHARHVRK